MSQMDPITVTPAQRTNVADAVFGELQRLKLGDSIAPGDVVLLKQCTASAVKLAITMRMEKEEDPKRVAAFGRRKNDIDAQLANFKAFASSTARRVFWEKVDQVLTRLIAFTF